MTNPIVVRNLGKRFRRRQAERPGTLKEALFRGFRRVMLSEAFWALRDVSFSVARGGMLGVIGPNGAGKSTLLRLVGGVGRPDEGEIETHGRIGALLSLGAGFHPDLTGRENAWVNGIISGMTRGEVRQRFDSIVAFAELEEFIDQPLRTYSTGMQMRLGFAVAVHTDPEILLIDEVLAVGDLAFQRKCLERILQLKAGGCAILLVSHDTDAVRQICDEALWLRHGEIAARGPSDAVVSQYISEAAHESRRRTPTGQPAIRSPSGATLELQRNRFGTQEMQIVAVRLLDGAGLPATELESGEPLRVEMDYIAPQRIRAPVFGVAISREDGAICFETSSETATLQPLHVEGAGRASLNLERLDLVGGRYYVDVGVYQCEWAYAYDYHWHVYPLAFRGPRSARGMLHPPGRWEFGQARLERSAPCEPGTSQ